MCVGTGSFSLVDGGLAPGEPTPMADRIEKFREDCDKLVTDEIVAVWGETPPHKYMHKHRHGVFASGDTPFLLFAKHRSVFFRINN